VIKSLFGIDPSEVLAAREAAAQSRALGYAQLDPMQQAMYGASMAGHRAGNFVGGLMGAQDPELVKASQRSALAREIDWSNPESVQAAVMKASQMGDQQAAMELASRFQQMKASATEQQLKRAQAMKAFSDAEYASFTPEMKNAAALTAAKKFPPGSPEYIEEFSKELKRLTTKEGSNGTIKEVGVAVGTREPVYTWQAPGSTVPQQVIFKTGPDGKQVPVPYSGGVDRSTAKVSATANGGNTYQEDEFSKELGKQNAKRLNDAMETAQASQLALNTVQAMREKNDTGQLYSGPQANVVKETANFLESIGLLSNQQIGRLTDSTTYDKFAKDLVMQDLGGKLGAQISDADRKFVEARIPQLTTNPQARKELLDKLEEIHNRKISYYESMQTHANQHRTLNNFNFAGPAAPAKPALGTAQNPIKLK
jgi:hypothetical protein